MVQYRHTVIAGSSNGRTTDSGSVYLGSSPSPAAKLSEVITLETHCLAKP